MEKMTRKVKVLSTVKICQLGSGRVNQARLRQMSKCCGMGWLARQQEEERLTAMVIQVQ